MSRTKRKSLSLSESEAKELMSARMERMKKISKDDIIKAKLLQEKLKKENEQNEA